MAMNASLSSKQNAGELGSKVTIKVEADPLEEDLQASDIAYQEFVMETDYLQYIKAEKEIDTAAAADYPSTPEPITEYTEYTITELMQDEDYIDNKNGLVSYSQENQLHTPDLADNQQTAVDIKEKDNVEKTFKCPMCPRSFTAKSSLTRHGKTHDDNRPRMYACEQCGATFLGKEGLGKHRITHATDRKREYKCHVCQKALYTRHGLAYHMNLHPEASHKCEMCSKCFTGKAHLETHMLRRHSSGLSHVCKLCKKSFKSALERRVHTCDLRRYKCEVCDKIYSQKISLRLHMKEHTGLPYKCGICGKKMSGKRSCRLHLLRFHKIADEEAASQFIQKIPTAEETPAEIGPLQSIKTEVERSHTDAVEQFTPQLQTHEYIKTELVLEEEFVDDSDSASYAKENQQRALELADEQQALTNTTEKETETCKICQKIYPKEYIETHRSRMHYEGVYKCEFCPRSFQRKFSLKTHLTTHANDRKRAFACHLCESTYYTKGALARHMTLHADNIYKCEVCGERFMTNANLEKHMLRRHTSKEPPTSQRYKCQFCDKNYSTIANLRVHIKEHTGLPWKCQICERKFPTFVRCRAHIIKVHKMTEDEAASKCVENLAKDGNVDSQLC